MLRRLALFTSLETPLPSFRAQPRAELVNTMNSDDVKTMLAMMDKFVDRMGFNFDPLPSLKFDPKTTEMLAKWTLLLKDILILGSLSWLAKNRHDILDMMFGGEFCIYLVK